MPTHLQTTDHQLARRVLDAFEREFWAGHHDRARLLSAPLRVLHQAMDTSADPAPLMASVLQTLESGTPTA
ncbi:hypothetical protein KBY96_14155 [Cyanobium sp. ATX 6A2]|uniref:hypothetical protein n=1 Tax=Cyanobium sp. ATX 6A2 TaxID=2823700 RepID=UPI0020CD9987|nr:hypothetical protein [Cyanobium sp. ATX 6A2]MCP9889066.1 hypothetical protein [Cyanobium sp. ATX 6A2]